MSTHDAIAVNKGVSLLRRRTQRVRQSLNPCDAAFITSVFPSLSQSRCCTGSQAPSSQTAQVNAPSRARLVAKKFD